MLITMEDVRKAEMLETGNVENGIDNPNLLSVDSTTPITTPVDEVKPEQDSKEDVKKEVLPKVEEKKVEAEVKAEVEKKVGAEVELDADGKPKEIEKKPDEKLTDDEDIDAVQKRINKSYKKQKTAERERDYEKTKREEAEAELAKLKAAIPAEDKPKRDDFETDLEFFEALTDWKVEQKLKVSKDVVEKATKETEDRQSVADAYEELDAIMERGRGKYQDFNQLVLNDKLQISEDMTETILLSDVAEDLMYYFGSHPDESAVLAKLPSLKAAKEVGRIEAVILAKAAKPAVEQPKVEKKITNAPEPIVPVKSSGVTERDPSQMTSKEYRAWREKNK